MGSEVSPYGVRSLTLWGPSLSFWGLPHQKKHQASRAASPALRVAAIQARQASIHHHDGGGGALWAQLSAFGEVVVGEGVDLLLSSLVFGALLLDQLATGFVDLGVLQEADGAQVPLDDVTELGNDRGHELAAGLPVATAWVEHGFELFDKEGHIAAFAEHGRD